MDIQERIEKQVTQVIKEELGESIHPDRLSTIIKHITEKLTFSVTPDELVLLRMKMDQKSSRELAVVSVIGQDSVGIVAEVTRVLAESSANIEGMNQTIVTGYFALILTIDITDMTVSIDKLQSMMDEIAEKKNLRIYIQHENIFKSMNRI
ncbi:MAG TPA: ACT domain-containing protein [Spirochaetota bacterium]|nr:ACT domain-containing protein [Spirochaetota bacterium]HPJ34911.1 ACT domain-containing protein [Spirochaetota bacterium]